MAACTFAVGTADTGADPNTSGAFTPALNDLLIVLVMASGTVADPGALSSSLGGGFTFTQFAAQSFSGAGESVYGFVADQLVSSATSQTVTFDATGDPATGTVIFVYRVSGMTLAGLSAILQSDTTFNGSGSTPRGDFPGNVLTGNPTLCILGNLTSPAGVTPPTSWTEPGGGDLGYSTPTRGAEVCHRDSGFTSTGVVWGSSSASAWGTIVVELDSSVPASGQPTGRRFGLCPYTSRGPFGVPGLGYF